MALRTRTEEWARLHHDPFDLLVIGGGITGCGIARDAARRGMRVLLCERDDFASGTSSRSSRLIHGGVRYLEHGWLHLVFEASRERRTLLWIAPHLVRPLPFTWPVYRGARIPRWKLLAGLWLYDLLALFRNVAMHQRLNAAEVLRAEPGLSSERLVGGARYYDASTSDTRLTLANALDASEIGASVLNHAAVRALHHEAGRVVRATVENRLTGEQADVVVRAVVNATGPWSDAVRRFDDPTAVDGVRGTKGVHVSVPRSRLPCTGAVTLLSSVDGRVMFVLPAGACTIIGTTDTYTTETPDEVRATEADVAYLLASANACFPAAQLQRHDVISAWAGLRPLVASAAAGAPSDASREHEIVASPSGVITVTGGKLTTYRAMAQEVTDRVEAVLARAPKRCETEDFPLPGGNIEHLAVEIADASGTVGDDAYGAHLVGLFGARWREVWALIAREPALNVAVTPGLPYRMVDLAYAIDHEFACTLGDLLLRRTPLGFECADHGVAAAHTVAAALGARLGWTPDAARDAVTAYVAESDRLFSIDP